MKKLMAMLIAVVVILTNVSVITLAENVVVGDTWLFLNIKNETIYAEETVIDFDFAGTKEKSKITLSVNGNVIASKETKDDENEGSMHVDLSGHSVGDEVILKREYIGEKNPNMGVWPAMKTFTIAPKPVEEFFIDNPEKITINSKKITGKALGDAEVALIVYEKIEGREAPYKNTIMMAPTNEDGEFVLKNFNMKPFEGCDFEVVFLKRNYEEKAIPLTINKQVKNIKLLAKKKLNKKSKSIKGKTEPGASVQLLHKNKVIKSAMANKKGVFELKKLKLKKYNNKTLTFRATKDDYVASDMDIIIMGKKVLIF